MMISDQVVDAVFDDRIPIIQTFDIGEAVRQMRAGEKVARIGWNGKGMWLSLIEGKQIEVFGEPQLFRPYVMMKTVDGCFVPWLCSQSDLLATDWCVAGKSEASPHIVLCSVEKSEPVDVVGEE